MKKYFVKFPQDFYAFDFYAKSIKEAKEFCREFFGYKRLPNGTEIWRV